MYVVYLEHIFIWYANLWNCAYFACFRLEICFFFTYSIQVGCVVRYNYQTKSLKYIAN